MKKINEEFLHFLWKNQHLSGVTLFLPGDPDIIVHDPGLHNTDAGPDFFNAKIEIGGTLWAGNVELHINASDWIRHGHGKDPAYNSVILHVVYYNDCRITRETGEIIPTAVLRFPGILWDRYTGLFERKEWIPCQEHLREILPVHRVQWISSLMIKKLSDRMEWMKLYMKDLGIHWDAIGSRMVFRSFGLPVNTAPFEMLSLLIPYSLLLRNRQNCHTLEAILFGQAGMLDTALPYDKYTEGLRVEFSRFNGRIEQLRVPLQSWKYLRMRPSSFPSLRIAQLASFIHSVYPIHPRIENCPSGSDLDELFKIKAGDYWNTHYQPGKESPYGEKYLGDQFRRSIIINSIVPLSFYFGKTTGKVKYCDYALHLLETTQTEDNEIIKKWGKFGVPCSNAFDSQALIYLYTNYCKLNNCLLCQFGNYMLLHDKNQK